ITITNQVDNTVFDTAYDLPEENTDIPPENNFYPASADSHVEIAHNENEVVKNEVFVNEVIESEVIHSEVVQRGITFGHEIVDSSKKTNNGNKNKNSKSVNDNDKWGKIAKPTVIQLDATTNKTSKEQTIKGISNDSNKPMIEWNQTAPKRQTASSVTGKNNLSEPLKIELGMESKPLIEKQ
ncbi:MAG: hypothetical protein ACRC2T_02820, partial [Thermoguttaceae bacterium]